MTSSDKRCAYCGESSVLTREHVWPECFLKRTGRKAAHFSVAGRRVHGADYVVRDVCGDCNSTLLAPLDAYFCALYDEYFVEFRDFDSTVTFRLDYDLLTRTLLKIAYNSARCAKSDSSPFHPLRSYILGLGERPQQLVVFLELVSPSLVSGSTSSAGAVKIMPEMYRSAITELQTANGRQVLTRVIAINSFYFHLVLPLPSTEERVFDGAVLDLENLIGGVVRLVPTSPEVVVRSSPQDGLRSITPFLRAHGEQFKHFFAKRRERDEGS